MRDVSGVKYFIVDGKKRFDLKWLYQKHQVKKVGPKVATKYTNGINTGKNV